MKAPLATPRRRRSGKIGGGHTDGLPLHARVKAVLRERIHSGSWRPGQMIPSEIEIGRELGVSQGTVRKVLDGLARESLVLRRQGKGTFVVEHTPDEVLFRFFHIYEDDGSQVRPESTATKAGVEGASRPQRERLGLTKGAFVIRIDRVRLRRGRPFLVETIVLPHARFPGLAELVEIPNTLYDLFQRKYGILVAGAEERISAVAASAAISRQLGIEQGSPLLRIDRIAFALDDRPIEWRVSLVHLDQAHYLARLR